MNYNDIKNVLNNEAKIKGKSHGPLAEYVHDIGTLFSVIKDYASGNYREIPWTTVASIVATLLYVLSPVDTIPDVIPALGLTDDAAVLALCLGAIRSDLQKYKNWKCK
ncbi:MAG: DUF1232 domain-containing protein [Acidobacteriota bacterium]|jgi:uncharacterized membrane protein YkvA (DUF1232 family)|nr:DUF1232 domain-containing protein [Acidobacteriota bacterium]